MVDGTPSPQMNTNRHGVANNQVMTTKDVDAVDLHEICEKAAFKIQVLFRKSPFIKKPAKTGSAQVTFKIEENDDDDDDTTVCQEDTDSLSVDKTETKSTSLDDDEEKERVDRSGLYMNVFVAIIGCSLIAVKCITSFFQFLMEKINDTSVTDGDPNLVQNGASPTTNSPQVSTGGSGGNGAAPQPQP